MTDFNIPVHITKLDPGISLKICTKPGYGYSIVFSKNGNYLRRETGVLRSWHVSEIYGRLIDNFPKEGYLILDATATSFENKSYRAEVKYSDISLIQKIVQFDEIVETASDPGARAKGTKVIGGILIAPRHKLINVKM